MGGCAVLMRTNLSEEHLAKLFDVDAFVDSTVKLKSKQTGPLHELHYGGVLCKAVTGNRQHTCL